MTEDPKGFICVFYSQPSDVIKGVVQPHAKRLVGTVERATPAIADPGRIKGYILHVRGRSGRLAVVDQVDQHAIFFLDWTSAMVELNKPIPH